MILTERPFEHFSLPVMNGFEYYEQRPDTSGAAASQELLQIDSVPCLKAEENGREVERPRFRFAMVCASNQNRSMAAHALLQKSGLSVNSYGTGSQVKLPGPSQKEPNVYSFGTTYQKMHDELAARNPSLYPPRKELAIKFVHPDVASAKSLRTTYLHQSGCN
eukprot:TRINITY_DN2333_c0_g1_i2.p1 TRINITY_DN2333_c0_g1~~TRINITY_DN2333_c0_g1_i2.p1  ORF type:complete len:163 (-),score=13.42 TRINITY_DN2333_c0_g1_i2:194-682(-)